MRLQLSAQAGDSWHDVHLDSSFAEDLGEPVRPYERLLYAAFNGDRQLFAREDAIEETWRIVQPVLDKPSRIHHYDQGSWGPEAAQALVRGHHSWHEPWLPRSKPTEK
jgi:glucose-6-phosphate 1-dehydrogenase